jgi:uncharacterized damage-inducible protein DinB
VPSRVERDLLEVPRGLRSPEAASFVRQLDTLSAYLAKQVPRLSVRELEWQPAPGMNSIGMLFAHLAIVEVWWTEVGIKATPPGAVDFHGVLGIGRDGDGMPLARRGRHPATLRGRGHAYYRRLLARARAHVKRGVRGLTARDLSRVRRRVRLDERVQVYNQRWVLFHLVEHFAGHFGQILLLRHAYRQRHPRPRRSR